MKKTKRIVIALFAVTLLFLAGCGNNVADNESSSYSSDETSQTEFSQESSLTNEIIDNSDENSNAANNTAEKKNKNSVIAKDNKQNSNVKSNYQSQTTAQSSDTTTVSKTKETVKDKEPIGTFSLTIDCKNALKKGKGKEYQDGIIYQNSAVEFYENEDLLTVLKRELKANNISIKVKNGCYVSSIGGLKEFDCGSNSGWLYKVNGTLPNFAMNKCMLKDGLTVEIRYTCSNGDV
ncbi:MAG: DUF4430 domain-containing protein [Clostridiales bacterium]|nr:DUF4430 domain-containing protein [Clostridiales bacterium]